MGFATLEYTGDTSTAGTTWIRITDTADSTDICTAEIDDRPEGLRDKACKACGEIFETFRRKEQICIDCKKLKRVLKGR